jgi:rRNA maturation protein Nop10
MKYFCSKCGKTTVYTFELPKFCSFCGESFASKSPPETTPKTEKFLNELKLKKNINYNNVDNELDEELPRLNFKNVKASFKLDVYTPKGESLGSLIENPSKPVDFEQGQQLNTKKTKEQILQEFQKEAGLSRNQE